MLANPSDNVLSIDSNSRSVGNTPGYAAGHSARNIGAILKIGRAHV